MMELRKRMRPVSYREISESDLPDEIEYDRTHYDISTYMNVEHKNTTLHNHDYVETSELAEPLDITDYSNDHDDDIPDLYTSSEEDTTDTDNDDEMSAAACILDEECCEEEEENQVNPNIPAPSFVSYNINGITESTERSNFIISNLTKLTKTFQIILTQETKLPDGGHRFIQKRFLKWGVYHSAKRSGSAGVMTMISPGLLADYKVETLVIEAGRALVLRLLPREVDEGQKAPEPITVINFYLKSGNCDSEKAALLAKARREVPACKFCLVGGDFNFVLQKRTPQAAVTTGRSPTSCANNGAGSPTTST